MPVDLSEVLFIATANEVSGIPKPLLDRMELIEVSSYTENEKFHIAKEHLIEKQKSKNGIKKEQLTITDGALKDIIRLYKRGGRQEAGDEYRQDVPQGGSAAFKKEAKAYKDHS